MLVYYGMWCFHKAFVFENEVKMQPNVMDYEGYVETSPKMTCRLCSLMGFSDMARPPIEPSSQWDVFNIPVYG